MLPFLLMGGFGAKPNGCNGNCSCHKDKWFPKAPAIGALIDFI
jgi:hypothetical protein